MDLLPISFFDFDINVTFQLDSFMESPKVSVIIPFYKVEAFVERCTRALMEQSLQEVEFIFVDDASPDGSRAIVERVVAEYDRDVRILTHPENRGLPAARNTGLAEVQGEFIWHCDSDDWPEPTMLEEMYTAATENAADFVYCDFYLDFGTSRRVMVNPSYTNPEQMVKEGFLAGLMKYNVWNKLVRRSLYTESGLRFPEGHAMGEDMTMILLTPIPTPFRSGILTTSALMRTGRSMVCPTGTCRTKTVTSTSSN